jgi:hypothetical protein
VCKGVLLMPSHPTLEEVISRRKSDCGIQENVVDHKQRSALWSLQYTP